MVDVDRSNLDHARFHFSGERVPAQRMQTSEYSTEQLLLLRPGAAPRRPLIYGRLKGKHTDTLRPVAARGSFFSTPATASLPPQSVRNRLCENRLCPCASGSPGHDNALHLHALCHKFIFVTACVRMKVALRHHRSRVLSAALKVHAAGRITMSKLRTTRNNHPCYQASLPLTAVS